MTPESPAVLQQRRDRFARLSSRRSDAEDLPGATLWLDAALDIEERLAAMTEGATPMSPYDAEMTLRTPRASRSDCAQAVSILRDDPTPYRRHLARQTTIAMGLTAVEIEGQAVADETGMDAAVDPVPLLFWLLVGLPFGLAVWLFIAPPMAAALYGWATGLAGALVDRIFGGMVL